MSRTIRIGPNLIVVCALAAVFGLLWLRLSRPGRLLNPKASVVAERPAPPPERERGRELFQGKREPLDAAQAAGISGPCLALWNRFRAYDLRQSPDALLAAGPIVPDHHGCADVPPALSETHGMVLKYCGDYQKLGDKRDSPLGRSLRAGCEATLTVYRSQIADHLTRDVPLEKIQDPRLLADKSLARWLDGPTGAAEAAERLLEIEPGLPMAAKISAMGRFLAARRAAGENVEGMSWDKSDAALARAKDADPEGRPLYEELQISTEIAKKAPLDRVEQHAQRLADENPQSGLGHFFLAWAENQRGNREGVERQLEAAIRAEPGQPRWAEALKALRSVPAGQNVNVFGGRLPFPLESMNGLNGAPPPETPPAR